MGKKEKIKVAAEKKKKPISLYLIADQKFSEKILLMVFLFSFIP